MSSSIFFPSCNVDWSTGASPLIYCTVLLSTICTCWKSKYWQKHLKCDIANRSNRANQQIVICCRSASKFRETCICLRLSYPFLTTEADMISVDCWEQGLQNRWEPVRFDRLPVWPGSGLGRYQTGPNSKFKFEFKK